MHNYKEYRKRDGFKIWGRGNNRRRASSWTDETDLYSATTRPPIALCISLIVWPPLPEPICCPPPLDILLLTSPGCLTPNAAPSILFPGSPILGPLTDSTGWGCCWCKLVDTIAGSFKAGPATVSPKDELMRALSVGWVERGGNVGEGSRPFMFEFSGMATCWPLAMIWLLRAVFDWGMGPEILVLRALGNTATEAARACCERERLGLCRELTVWMTDWASGPS